jgi:hypothetical protein
MYASYVSPFLLKNRDTYLRVHVPKKKGPVPKDEPLIGRGSKNYFLTGGATTW